MTLEEALKKYDEEKANFLKVFTEKTDERKKLPVYKKYNSAYIRLLKLYEKNLNNEATKSIEARKAT